jgi:hypothetical protein
MRIRTLVFCTIMASSLIVSAPTLAFAGEPTRQEQASKLADEATDLFKAHDYAKANEKYAQAYVLDPDPNLLYNQARCYESSGDRPAADSKYKEFLSKPGGDVNAQKRAKAFVEEFAKNPAGTSATATTPAAGGATQPSGTTTSPQGGITTEGPRVTTQPVPSEGSGGKTAGYVMLAGGGVLLASGIVVYILGTSDHNKITNAEGFGDKTKVTPILESEARDLSDSGTTKKTIGGVLMGVGGAVAVVGGILAFTGGTKKSASGKPQIGFVPLMSGGFLNVQGAF